MIWWKRVFWICHWTLSGGRKGELGLPRVHFGVKKVLWRETRVESSEEEGKGYSLWEQLRTNAWECSQAPKNGEEQPPKPKSGEK